jgi:hypothetical protein
MSSCSTSPASEAKRRVSGINSGTCAKLETGQTLKGSKQVKGNVLPIGIILFDQLDLLGARPFLDDLLARWVDGEARSIRIEDYHGG